MKKNNDKQKNNSPFSVARRQTVFLDSKDPRANGSVSNIDGTLSLGKSAEVYRSSLGSDVIVKESKDPIDLKDYIFQCIYDTAEVLIYANKETSVSDTVLFNETNFITDEVAILFLDVDQINLAETFVLNGNKYYQDQYDVYAPTELFEIFVSEIQGSYTNTSGDSNILDLFGLLYAVTYDGNGRDEGSAPLDINSYELGSNVTVLSSGTLLKYNYAFTGWNTLSNGTGTTYQPGDQIIGISDNITLYAKWQRVYTVTYYGNGNNEGVTPIDLTSYFDNEIATVLGQGTLIKYGSTFAGWNTQSDGNGTTYQFNDTITVSGADIKLYAKWV